MNFDIHPYEVAFLALAALAALISLRSKQRLHVVFTLVVVTLVGWGLEFASVAWIDAAWHSLMEHTPNASTQLIEQYNTDAAGKAAVLLFGVPVSLIYAATWFILVHGTRIIFKRKVHA